MKRLYLHIGAHKTGTTTLQQCFSLNGEALAEHGFSYAASPDMPQLHPFLGYAHAGDLLPDGFAVTRPDALRAQLARASGPNVIASSENFSFFFQRPAIEALAAILRPLFDQIRIVVYLRRQDSHAVSHHQEGAKPHRRPEGQLWGHAVSALPQPSEAQALYLDYNRRLGLWADVFGQDAMIIRLYDRAILKGGDIVADFLDQLGLGAIDMQGVDDRNVSLGAAQAKAGHILNAAGVSPLISGEVLKHIRDTGRQLPSQSQAQAFLQPYREGNRALNARFAISTFPDLFPDSFDDLPAAAQEDWTEAGATSALQAMARQLQDPGAMLSELGVPDLRLAVLALRGKHPEVARRILNVALTLRPDAPNLLRLKAEFEKAIGDV